MSPTSPLQDRTSFSEKVFDSAIFMVGANVLRQSIGIVSMIILARILSPADYGLIALSGIVIQFFDVFAQTGINQYILSRTNLDERDIYTAWTVRLIIRLALAATVIATALPVSAFFGRPELSSVLTVAALVPIVNSLENPGLLLLRREMTYRRIALITVIAKISGFIVALSIAIETRSYWALIVGDIVAATTYSLVSYRLHKMRPRLSFRGFDTQWKFSRWILIRSILGYVRAKVDSMIIGRHIGVPELGVYTLSKQLATLPHEHLNVSISDMLLTSMTRDCDKPHDTAFALSRILVVQISLILPIVVGLWFCSDLLVLSLLGEKWLSAIPVLQVLAILALSFSIASTITLALVSLDRVKDIFYIDLATVAVVILVLVGITKYYDLIYVFALTRAVLGIGIAVVFYFYISICLPMPHRSLMLSLLPTVSATMIMSLALAYSRLIIDSISASIIFIVVPIGIIFYLLSYIFMLRIMRNYTNELKFFDNLIRIIMSSAWVRLKAVVER